MILLHLPGANNFFLATLILLISIVILIYLIIAQLKKITNKKSRNVFKFLKVFLLLLGVVILLINNVVLVGYIFNQDPGILILVYIVVVLFIYLWKRYRKINNSEENKNENA